jgi:hypothetical protein
MKEGSYGSKSRPQAGSRSRKMDGDPGIWQCRASNWERPSPKRERRSPKRERRSQNREHRSHKHALLTHQHAPHSHKHAHHTNDYTQLTHKHAQPTHAHAQCTQTSAHLTHNLAHRTRTRERHPHSRECRPHMRDFEHAFCRRVTVACLSDTPEDDSPPENIRATGYCGTSRAGRRLANASGSSRSGALSTPTTGESSRRAALLLAPGSRRDLHA